MFDKTFKISLKDLILFATIFIGFGVTKERLSSVEEKVDTIYSFYVSEGFKKQSSNFPTTEPEIRMHAILDYQQIRLRKEK